MNATARHLSPTPAPDASEQPDASGALTLVPEPRPVMPYSFGPGRLLGGYGQTPSSQFDEIGGWVIWGGFAELTADIVFEPSTFGLILGNAGLLATFIVGQLAMREAERRLPAAWLPWAQR